MKLADLPTPCAVMDLDVVERNIDRMSTRAEELGVRLRPHVKTHKIPFIGRMQTPGSFKGITVSTLAEARTFAEAGFTDITWALPLPLHRLREVVDLGAHIDLGVLVDNADTAARLAESGERLRVWMKLDCGNHRAGVDPTDPASIDLARVLYDAKNLDFQGTIAHAGHSYSTRGDPERLQRIAEEERDLCVDFANRCESRGVAFPHVSIGSTPTCAVIDQLEGVTEIRPGNYVFFDLFQQGLGVCGLDDIALTVISSVLGQHQGRMVLDAGALALSKDPGHEDGSFGRVRSVEGQDLPIELKQLSQEHGLAQGHLPGLDRVRILPNHSCLVAAMHPRIYGVRGDEVVGSWIPARGW
ncbi:MAG: alanine racemase [Proteobacteria bacterium]|nr:alanine racemase [Pseudomonadota bacterium]